MLEGWRMIRDGSDIKSGTSAWTTFVCRNGIPFSSDQGRDE